MSWYWHGAYVESKTQNEVVRAMQRVMQDSTNGRVATVQHDARVNYGQAASGILVVVVSPQEDEWTAFWGATHRLCTTVFRECGLSGLLVGGHDPLSFSTADKNSWDLMVWDQGVITDWFVSNPSFYFSEWYEGAIFELVIPYLQRKGLIDSIGARNVRAQAMITNSAKAFQGDVEVISRLVKPGVSESSIMNWLTLPTIPALSRLNQILDVPFSSPQYNIHEIALALDQNKGQLHQGSPITTSRNDLVAQVSGDSEGLPVDVRRFTPILFQSTLDWQQFLLEFGEVFYYA